LGRVEAAEMLADDVLGRIALDALGAGVPVGHPPFWVEHEDGVIGDSLDEDPEGALGLEQRLLGLALLGHVAGNLGEADQLALLVPYRIDDDARPETRAVLAHAPAFALELALVARGLEHLFGHACLAVLVRVEGREM